MRKKKKKEEENHYGYTILLFRQNNNKEPIRVCLHCIAKQTRGRRKKHVLEVIPRLRCLLKKNINIFIRRVLYLWTGIVEVIELSDCNTLRVYTYYTFAMNMFSVYIYEYGERERIIVWKCVSHSSVIVIRACYDNSLNPY